MPSVRLSALCQATSSSPSTRSSLHGGSRRAAPTRHFFPSFSIPDALQYIHRSQGAVCTRQESGSTGGGRGLIDLASRIGRRSLRCRSSAEEAAVSDACIPVAAEALTERGLGLLDCLIDSPDKFCAHVREELEVLRDGLLNGELDLPSSKSREQELRLAGDIIYCWMLAEAYCLDDGMAREMRALLHRGEGEQLAEGESWRRQLNAAQLMCGKRGVYKLGAVRFSPSIKEQARKTAKEAVDAPADVAREEWEKTQGKALAMDREQAALLFCTWAKSGYLDRRLDDRVKLDRMVTGVSSKKSQYYQALVDDMMAQATDDSAATPSPLTSQLVQIRSEQALQAIQMHTDQMLSFGDSRPVDSFSQSIPTDFIAIQHMMEEACRCGRSLYDGEKLVSQYIELTEQLPDSEA
eukprot:CAMPEP_0177752238 /NCGR_PEP_ID=MMETSP0491_2-20121128/811_1 /TAXON_ID=63592 /ORGANISM="Tetraselmis chuii, Strain PLY429" /LENGTH=408 /DNA_ID=CAMNT_0019267425 /DNA_START=167 /DNA_END=1393 /DNA_ORIENTATION=+